MIETVAVAEPLVSFMIRNSHRNLPGLQAVGEPALLVGMPPTGDPSRYMRSFDAAHLRAMTISSTIFPLVDVDADLALRALERALERGVVVVRRARAQHFGASSTNAANAGATGPGTRRDAPGPSRAPREKPESQSAAVSVSGWSGPRCRDRARGPGPSTRTATRGTAARSPVPRARAGCRLVDAVADRRRL